MERVTAIRGRGICWICAAALALTLAGCGWHLRGSAGAALAFDSAQVTGAENDAGLRLLLQNALERSEVSVVKAPAEADVIVVLGQVISQRRVLSVASGGGVEEYALYYAVNVGATDKNGEVLLQTRPVELTRDFQFDKNAALAKGGEEELLLREMRNEVVREILRRLRAVELQD